MKRSRPTRHTASANTGAQLTNAHAHAHALRTELETLRSDMMAAVAAAVHKEVRAAMLQLGVWAAEGFDLLRKALFGVRSSEFFSK